MKSEILVTDSRGQKQVVKRDIKKESGSIDLFSSTLPGVFFTVTERRK